jgi:hypothetical protein
MTHNITKTSTTQHNPAAGGGLLILLCAPSHDTLTQYTSGLLAGFPSLGAPALLHKFSSPLRYDQLLASLPINQQATDVALVFCGHGEPSELQGPGAHPGAPGYSDARSAFYDSSLLQAGAVPKFMLAFCSSAAADLGPAYWRNSSGQVFVGFDKKIGFVIKDGDCADWWKKLLHGAATAMLNNAGAVDPEEPLRQLYKSAIAYFNSPEGRRRCKWWLAMSMYLRRQLDSLKFIP